MATRNVNGEHTQVRSARYGCIGKKLTHSFSKEVHGKIADYSYELIELSEAELVPFLKNREFAAINVTIPYKQAVIPFLNSVNTIAAKIGAVNTIVHKDGALYGYNTDYHGLKALIERAGIDPAGKKVLVLGSGGTSKTARVVVEDMGASQILTISRKKSNGCITYEEAVSIHNDADVIINTTPSGMYPDCGAKPIEIARFSQLSGVIDVVYNPLCTNLVLDAKQKGINAEGGLYMLVIQAVAAAEHFLDKKIDPRIAEQVYACICAEKESALTPSTADSNS